MTSDGSRIGLLGGTFDPVHYGHLDAADAARRALALAAVVLVPSRVAEYPGLRVSDLELRSPEPSYTSLTLQQLARVGYAPAQLFFILGSDAFAEIAHWHDFPGILNHSHFAVVARAGRPLAELRGRLPALADRMREPAAGPDAGAAAGSTSIWLVDAATRDVSSSGIRRRLAASEPTGDLLPEVVAAYISRHRLYDATSRGGLFA